MSFLVSVVLVALTLVAGGPDALAQTPKPGGSLAMTLREDLPQGFSIHESSTISSVWPVMPCLNNLVPSIPKATGGSRHDHRRAGREVVVAGQLPEPGVLSPQDVKWHDGKPFTSKDVKYTFDMVREAPDAPVKPESARGPTGTRTWRGSRRPTRTLSSSGLSARSRRC